MDSHGYPGGNPGARSLPPRPVILPRRQTMSAVEWADLGLGTDPPRGEKFGKGRPWRCKQVEQPFLHYKVSFLTLRGHEAMVPLERNPQLGTPLELLTTMSKGPHTCATYACAHVHTPAHACLHTLHIRTYTCPWAHTRGTPFNYLPCYPLSTVTVSH